MADLHTRVANALARNGARLADALARRRVPLGFVVALSVLIFARPVWPSWQTGLAIAAVGEAVRIWAAGHLEKGREVTRSGPYQWIGHPLYVGSSAIAFGVAVACNNGIVAALILVYMASTLTAAIRTEEAFLSRQFGEVYDLYRRSAAEPATRRFSLARARKNREYRAVMGIIGGFALLALKIILNI
jgi:protein-S-isoprenylcysteine O-methyltransferase Ste14